MMAVLAIILGAALYATPADANVVWSERAFDPDDLACHPAFYHHCFGFDVLGSGLRIKRADDGRRYLIIRLRTRETHQIDTYYRSLVALDARGNDGRDFLVYLNNPWPVTGEDDNGCAVRLSSPGSAWHRGVFRQRRHQQIATCRLPLWRILTG